MPAAMAVHAIVIVALRIASQPLPAPMGCLVPLPTTQALLAANVRAFRSNPLNEFELPSHDVAARGAVQTVVVIAAVTAQKGQARRLCGIGKIGLGASPTAGLGRPERERLVGGQPPTGPALERDMIPVANPAMDPEALVASDEGPSFRHGPRIVAPFAGGHMTGAMRNVQATLTTGHYLERNTADRRVGRLVGRAGLGLGHGRSS
ncbi:MAG: hypothetical protein DCO97_21455 [Marivita sp. XM-24bin2]|nr:MAG: hypothetical protein DCO97_21455 [Marivita sp. XM-24bin2]